MINLFTLEQAVGQPKEVLGGKGWGLVRMIEMGLRVPPAIIIPTSVCIEFQKDPVAVMEGVKAAIPFIKAYLTEKMGYMPLVSVRSGAAQSMPGMMDTILNVGLCQGNVEEWAGRVGRKCYDKSFGALIEMYGDVVMGIDRKVFEGKGWGARLTTYKQKTLGEFPTPDEQLLGAISAVFKSWNNPRAIAYRDLNKISHDGGTAVTIQSMVFGNMNDKSCTGVLFTRNPSNGSNVITGEFLVNAQGEEVVAGIRTPVSLTKMAEWNAEIANELLDTVESLEKKAVDMQDVEFTVQDGVLWFLQTRNGKRTAAAAVQIACDLHDEGMIKADEVCKRVSFRAVMKAQVPDIAANCTPVHGYQGLAASSGVAQGYAVNSSEEALKAKKDGLACILVTDETTPNDILGMNAAVGFLTRKGGVTCHAAVVGRGMDKPAVVGCGNLPKIESGQKVTICGTTGRVWIGDAPAITGGEALDSIKRLSSIVAKAYGYMRVCVTVADVSPKNSLIVAAMMDDAQLTKALKKMKEGVVDMRTREELVSDAELAMMTMCGRLDHKVEISEKMQVMLALPPSKAAFIPSKSMTEGQIETLAQHGYNPIRPVIEITDLILAEGLVVLDEEKLKASSNKKALAHLLKLKKAAKEQIEQFQIIDRVSGTKPDGVFAMSDMQAFQSFLAE